MTQDDIPEAMRLKEIAGWNQTTADWQRFLFASPDGCFTAEYEGRVIGTVTTIVYEDRFAWIAQLLVDPEHRGRGIGTALLKCAIEYLDSQNVACMKLDATPQGKPLYLKLGFVPEYEIERWTLKRQVDKELPHEAAARIDDVVRFDREIFGRGQRGSAAVFSGGSSGVRYDGSARWGNRRVHVRSSRRACRPSGAVDGQSRRSGRGIIGCFLAPFGKRTSVRGLHARQSIVSTTG